MTWIFFFFDENFVGHVLGNFKTFQQKKNFLVEKFRSEIFAESRALKIFIRGPQGAEKKFSAIVPQIFLGTFWTISKRLNEKKSTKIFFRKKKNVLYKKKRC